jgi:hypothetical protein
MKRNLRALVYVQDYARILSRDSADRAASSESSAFGHAFAGTTQRLLALTKVDHANAAENLLLAVQQLASYFRGLSLVTVHPDTGKRFDAVPPVGPKTISQVIWETLRLDTRKLITTVSRALTDPWPR